MDFKGLIDFNKYTLAVAAAGFVYALEKFVPMPTLAGRWLLLALLGVFLLSAVSGVLVFAVATKALHAGDSNRQRKIEDLIARLGATHAVLLLIGLLGLGAMLVDRIMSEPPSIQEQSCCCPQQGVGGKASKGVSYFDWTVL